MTLASGKSLLPIIDIHTHCAPRLAGDRFGVAAAMRGTPVGRNMVTNYRGLPAVGYHEMTDFDLQQEVSARAGVTHRILSNPFPAETWTAVSSAPSLDIVKFELLVYINQDVFIHRFKQA